MAMGTRVHSNLENYAKSGDVTHLTPESNKYKNIVDRINSQSGDKYFEYMMAITADKAPCEWESEKLWFRGIADVLVVDGKTAYCLDYKTGKPKSDPTQLMIFSLLTFAHFPEVEEVNTSFLWLAFDHITSMPFKRQFANSYWEGIEARVARVHESEATNNYPTKPSKLCNWCAAKELCPDAYEERGRRKSRY